MPRMDKLSTYKTTVAATANTGAVTYINTCIVAWDGNTVTLNSGGWMTVTTKRKMNQASYQFGLRYGVHQVKGEWFVTLGDCRLVLPFKDGMKFNCYTGEVL